MNIISPMRVWFAELLRRRPSVGIAALAVLLLLSASLGHEGLRVPQMLLLALPGLIWLRWPVRSPSWRRLRLFGVALLLGVFLLDGFLRAYLRQRYAAVPDSTLVLTAAANTSPREALEYLMAQGAQWWPALVALLLALGLLLGLVRLASQQPPRPLGTGSRWLWLGLLLLCFVAHASKPWRRHHPAAFWPHWAVSVETLRMNWSDQSRQREFLLEQARASGVRALGAESSTVVLVLTDSVNRDNMSLYGYQRETTPQLQALSREEGARLLVLPHAWSVQATTVAALDGLFSFGGSMAAQPGSAAPAPGHILALARAAGYRVWWMSNHDDLAIEQQHAQLADTVEMINREPGRSSSMLDGELLDSLEEALADRSAPRKLIVLHLLGAHPHYRLRAPEALRPFEQGGDAVEREMQRQQRPVWLREQRQDYDAVIHYHDGVVAETLRMLKRHVPAGGEAAWMYLSDHGQEVGHRIDHAGHSPGTEAGYRIPAMLWRTPLAFAPGSGQQPFRADWTGWTLAELLRIEWPGMEPARNVFDPRYRWEAPQLPIGEVDFAR
ncbi:sulfatase-like hydrolase/transferase [Roseateles sp.]|uniref:sulfatase-like hydrolase/transferase n=1 Tax=Roseateles sp. TaxID=1971397 RepID=UPI003D14BB75